ncbi:MAG: Asp-tRNA(Asn)/Glu-tRNA(Gln) amidotransferase subunit GatC [Gammaproteobacteria bacterium]|jgi:aspartyl-tRNA(Asn)/glutamyl-tRNA(Gln) amidotransferase subunit C|nr:Asp-tRNA(Asn)/Glu-tRNA(Gln) amidotransferase subunit GatC [Gammaproteobacteria bacterium]
MSLSTTDLLRVARLARLQIADHEAETYAAQLSGILAHFSLIGEVNTDSVPPLAHAIDAVGRLREDIVSEAVDRDQLQAGAPLVENGYYLVPRVIE